MIYQFLAYFCRLSHYTFQILPLRFFHIRCLLVSLMALCFSNISTAQFEAERAYLQNNFEPIFTDTSCGLACFSEPADKYRFYFTGEKHDHRGNTNIELALLEQLVNDRKINTYLLENSYSGEYLLKKFLSLPDTNLESNPYIPLLYRNKKKDFDEYYLPLYLLIDSTPQSLKPEIRGIDIEMNLGQAYRVLYYIISQHETTDSVMLEFVNTLDKAGKSKGKRRLYSTADMLDTTIIQKNTQFRQLLGTDFADFDKIVKGIKAGKSWLMNMDTSNYQLAYEVRENYMFQNVKAIVESNPTANFFGQFGFTHVVSYRELWLGKITNWNSLATRIENELELPICRTVIFYTKTLSKKIKYAAVQSQYEKLFEEFAEERLTIFNLNKPNSPFRNNGTPIKREYCETYTGKDYPVDISLEFNYLIINNYFQF